jgi:hypothetical protein
MADVLKNAIVNVIIYVRVTIENILDFIAHQIAVN